MGFTLGFGDPGQIDHGQIDFDGLVDAESGAAAGGVETGTEDFVAANDFVQSGAEGGDVERTGDADAGGDIVLGAARFEVVEEPESFLGEGSALAIRANLFNVFNILNLAPVIPATAPADIINT